MDVMAFDKRTGRRIEQRDPQEILDELYHERDMRDLGADPELYPSASDGDLAGRIRFHQVHRDAAIAANRIAGLEAEAFDNWETEFPVDSD